MRSERIQCIRNYIDERGEVAMGELLALYPAVSSMTVWRDLKYLEEEGVIKRVRGGAIIAHSARGDVESVYNLRAQENMSAKKAIAAAALPFVQPGHAVYLDAGSTVMTLVQLLGNLPLNIITSGANIAVELSRRQSVNVMLTGGQVSKNTLSCSGPSAEAFLESVNIDTAIMATSGFSLTGGFSSGSASEQQLKRKVIAKADCTVLLTDLSKVGRNLPFTFASLADIDTLILDGPPPQDILAAMVQSGTQLLVASP